MQLCMPVTGTRINKHKHCVAQKSQQAGVTLIELLIAMGLSVFLMAAVVQVFLGSKQTSEVVNAQTRMQESARYAMMFVARSLRMGGYLDELIEPNGLSDVTLTDVSWRQSKLPAISVFETEAFVFGEDGSGAVSAVPAKANSDTVSVRLQGAADGAVSDCLAQVLAAGEWAEVTFYIDGQDDFHCRSIVAGVTQNNVLVEGVEELQILYGVNAGVIDPTKFVENPDQVVRWVNALGVGAEQWRFVVAVRLAVVTASNTAPLSTAGAGISYTLLDYTTAEYDDGKARQQFAQTIRIRNQTLNSEPI